MIIFKFLLGSIILYLPVVSFYCDINFAFRDARLVNIKRESTIGLYESGALEIMIDRMRRY